MGQVSFHPPPLPAWPLMLAAGAVGLAAGLIHMVLSPDQAVNAAGTWTVAVYGGGLLGAHMARANNRTFMRGLNLTRETLEELLTELHLNQTWPRRLMDGPPASRLPALGAITAPASTVLIVAGAIQLLLGDQASTGPIIYSAAGAALIYVGTTLLNHRAHVGAIRAAEHATTPLNPADPKETRQKLEQAIRTVSGRQQGALNVHRTLDWWLRSVQGA